MTRREFHVLPRHGRWQIMHDQDCVGIHDSRDAALAHACTLAHDTGASHLQSGWTLVLHEGREQRRISVPH